MNEIRRALALICSMAVLKTSLSLLLPDGGLKRFAQFGFAAVQTAVLAELFLQMMRMLLGVYT